LVAALLDQGAGPLDANAFKARQDDTAVRFGFGAAVDRFGGSVRMLAERRVESIELLRLALAEPRFDAEAVERARRQTIVGLRRAEQSPGSVAGRVLATAVFGAHPYGRPASGTLESVAAITAEDLRALAKSQFTRAGLTVAVVGDTTAAEIGPLLDRVFGALPAGGAPVDIPAWTPGAPKPGGRLIVVERDVPQSVVLLATPAIRRDDPDWYAAMLMNHVLGGAGFAGRLMTEVREKRGLAYGASSRLTPYKRAGLFSASVATGNARVAESLAIVREQIALMAKDGVSDAELADAKTYLDGSLAVTLDSTGAIANLLHGMRVDGLAPDHLTRRKALIDAVTKDAVKRVAARILREDLSVTVVVGKPQGVTATE
ncbi:MAG: insulinase family protein, partial [Rhodospirillales bacterium]|nr:insulinase family protein [Rhodospirillales bacterium]